MSKYKYMILAVGYSGGMQSDPGKGWNAVAGEPAGGEFKKGYEIAQGQWEPNGLWMKFWDTREELNAWLASDAGKDWKGKTRDVLVVRLKG